MYDTQIIPYDSTNSLDVALEYLQNCEVIAAPTDTVYGVMASCATPSAIQQIYSIKERPLAKALPILIGAVEQLDSVAFLPTDGGRHRLMEELTARWWPGALTLVLPARPELPQEVTGALSRDQTKITEAIEPAGPASIQKTVAVRLPNHDWLCKLIQIAGPVAATSANLSGHAETTSAPAVMEQLSGRLPIIFDGGICSGGVGSTIVDLTNSSDEPPAILRAGPLADEIKALSEFGRS